MSVPNDRSKEWEALLDSYKSSIPEKIKYLSELVKAVQKTPSLETLEALRFAIHKLAGNSGMYGYPEVSLICKECENEIVKKIERLPISPLDPKWISNLSGYLIQIEEGFNKPCF